MVIVSRGSRHRGALSALVLGLSMAVASSSFGQSPEADKATARSLGREGQQALEAKDYATAADRFGRADALFHAPTLLLGLARAQVGGGKWLAAHETYNRIVREGPGPNPSAAFVHAIEQAATELRDLESRTPAVVVTVEGEAGKLATVTLDGADLAPAARGIRRLVDPGDHVVRAAAEGFQPVEKRFRASERSVEKLSLKLESAAAPGTLPMPVPPPVLSAPPAPPAVLPSSNPTTEPAQGSSSSVRRTLGFAAMGLGGIALVTGGITGGLALVQKSDLDAGCKANGDCPKSLSDTLDSYEMFGTVSTATVIGGGVAFVAGIVLVATAPSAKRQKEALQLTRVGNSAWGIGGRF